MLSALDIAEYFIAMDSEDEVSNLKLQKLLYYAQGSFLAIFNKPLFKEHIEAWRHGPVIREVYNYYKEYGSNPIKINNFNGSFFDSMMIDEKEIIEEVQDIYGSLSAWKLRDMTHQDACWKNNYISDNPTKVIPLEEIKITFASKVA